MLIGEFAQVTGVSARMLRYYEKHGLIAPSARSTAGYRDYDDGDVERVFHIEGLRGLGLSVAEVKSALEDAEFSFPAVIDELIVHSQHRLREEKRLYDKLRAVKASAATDWQAALEVVNLLHNLRSSSPSRRQDSAMRLAPGVDIRQVARLALSEENPNVAGALAWAVLRTQASIEEGARDLALEEIVRGLDHEHPHVRLRAVRILAQVENPEDFLLQVVDDSSQEVRRTAALVLGERGGEAIFEELITMIVEGDHDTDAAEVLAQSKGWHERGVVRIEKLVRDLSLETAQRVRLVQALAEFRDTDAEDILASLTADDNAVVALTAQAILRAHVQRSGSQDARGQQA
ncbi:MerR family transcriptional regulator [Corynebacterium sp. J010B-136]|uniref:MerR family transcriptional regulator n=1 Tax=Corynebacterium sp. J010B-136 TaxID=2099401 RepID=UPI000CF9A80F|nr:MerR family transcriptional regulator [Corynebacterium sp. J010B-136]PQM74716.1 MerR family transcriptional regulator [Corynebacterium sp. J010B-136]